MKRVVLTEFEELREFRHGGGERWQAGEGEFRVSFDLLSDLGCNVTHDVS
jgi:hypothetical protein